MKGIATKLWSHQSLSDEKRHYVNEVISSKPLIISTFAELVKTVAKISYHNPEYSLFFRAQDKDYQNVSNQSTAYPKIYRSITSRKQLNDNFLKLSEARKLLIRELGKARTIGRSKINKFNEMPWAILQHYEVCGTPLLDVTHSLRVACSMALESSDLLYPCILVIALPYPTGTISYYVDLELVNVRLISICPPDALRPYFQEGYLIGSFPSSALRSSGYDVAKRIIAKFQIDRKNFMSNGFLPIDHDELFPIIDSMKQKCENIKAQLEKKTT